MQTHCAYENTSYDTGRAMFLSVVLVVALVSLI